MYGDISIFGNDCTPNTNHNPKLNPLPLPPGQRDITCRLKKLRIFMKKIFYMKGINFHSHLNYYLTKQTTI